jgi:protein-S-isoprenylcysteine O-methyltransferase Ste14
MVASILLILASLAVWGALHSVTASLTAKAWAQHWFGTWAGVGYRLAFNLFSILTFLPILVLVALLPDTPLYQFPLWLTFITLPIQTVAAVAALIVLWQVDVFHFLGLRQLIETRPDSKAPPKLYTGGVYGWVRHPLYFFSLVILWLIPMMTVNTLTFNLGATLYFYIGAVFEERKLVAEFGDVYREHQRTVPMLIPFPRWKQKGH